MSKYETFLRCALFKIDRLHVGVRVRILVCAPDKSFSSPTVNSIFFCHAYTDIGKALKIISFNLDTLAPSPFVSSPEHKCSRTIASPGIVVVVVVDIVDINFNHTFHTQKLTVAI